ncbi:MAG: SDR family NAD(P)-dependent oxidoreductase, partial [Chloroflexota bacterium]
MPNKLKGRVMIVTGAGRGVGAAVARALAAQDARVAVNDINPDRAERVAQEIKTAGGRALAVQADVANKFQCVKLVEAVRAEWQQLDVLVNAAHVSPKSTVLQMDEWDWNRCLEVNLKGVFFMSQLCGRVMDDSRRGGVIVNVISEAGVQVPLAEGAAFCASQAAIVGFARECAREYADYGIDVHTLLRDAGQDVAPDKIATAVVT